MKKLLQRLVCLLLTTFLVMSASAARLYTTSELSSNLITSICQDKKGYIWIGTEYGLNRFDGVRFAQYYADDPVPHPLQDNNVRSLMTDREGRLWVQLASGIQRHDEQTGEFLTLTFRTQEILTMASLVQRRDGTLLVLTASDGVWKIDAKTMTAVPDERLNKGGVTTDAHTMIEDSKGRLWIATNHNGLTMIDSQGRHHHYGEAELGSKGVSGIGQDGRGRMTVLSRTQLLLYNEKTQRLDPLMPVDKALSARRMFSSPQGDLYIGTFGHGLLRVDIDKKEFITTEERMPVVTDPGVLNPYEFIGAVINRRLPNPFMPDAPQRIAMDTSQKLPIRFGETIKKYIARGLDMSNLVLIPLTLAGYARYLKGIKDDGTPFEPSPDPMLEELQAIVAPLEIGKAEQDFSCLKSLYSRKDVFGLDLYEAGLGEQIEGMVKELYAGNGAVRKTLHKYVMAR